MMTLKDVQEVSLVLLKEFHKFCVEHNLRYSLTYGTLIGAVRHQGFIPWDDDVDVMMPRPDYDRFVKLYKDDDRFACLAPEKRNSLFAYARLVDLQRTFVRPGAPWSNVETGIWIDIFPIDGVEDNKEKFLEMVKRTYPIWRRTVLARQAMGTLSFKKSLMWNLKRLIKIVLYRNKHSKYFNKQMEVCKRFNYDDCLHVSNLTHMLYASRSYFPKEMFENYIDIQFDNNKFKCIKDYHEFLKMIYGDYMTLPPEEKRKGHIGHMYFWK